MATLRAEVAGHRILVVSRDGQDGRLWNHRNSFERAGYRVSQARSLWDAACLAGDSRPNLIVLEPSFSEREQVAFVDCLHESYPGIHVLCLRSGDASTEDLLWECRSILMQQPGGKKVHTLRNSAA
jgi:DNA-binding NtrC family response regulator